MNKLFCVGFGVFIGLLLAGLMVHFGPKPTPEIITKIIEVPTTEKPDLRIQSQTKLTGQAKITPVPALVNTFKDESIQPDPQNKREAILALRIDSEFATQLTGEQRVNYYNHDNNLIGSGVHPVTADLTTRVLHDGLDYSLDFPDSVAVKIDYKPPDLRNRIEIGYGDWFFVNYTYSFKPVFVRYGYDFGSKAGGLSAGLAIEF
jgi:hypothetical protein